MKYNYLKLIAVGILLTTTNGIIGMHQPPDPFAYMGGAGRREPHVPQALAPEDQAALNEQLFRAIHEHNYGEVQALIRRGAQVNARGALNTTPLHEAAQGRYVEIIELLLNNGADIDAQNDAMETPLMTAISHLIPSAALSIISHNPNVELQNDRGETALILACQKLASDASGIFFHEAEDVLEPDDLSWGTIIDALLERNANVNIVTNEGKTALIELARGEAGSVAASERITRCAQELIDHGANRALVDNTGNNALEYAAQAGNIPLQRLLLGIAVQPQEQLNEELFRAIEQNNNDGVENLLRRGAQVNAPHGPFGRTPLHEAVLGVVNIPLIELLLRFNANINAQNEVGETPLMAAISMSLPRTVLALINHNPEIDLQNDIHETALLLACRKFASNEEDELLGFAVHQTWSTVIDALLDRHANVNLATREGSTALLEIAKKPADTQAAQERIRRIARRLIDMGANINHADNAGMTALAYARRQHNGLLENMLLQAMPVAE